MPYEPTEWVRGTKITASKLNNIESGVESVNSEYTPTTWAEGDIVTATKLNNIEQGIANASGGGGGNFSVAQVTIINNTNTMVDYYAPLAAEQGVYDDDSPALCFGVQGGLVNGEDTFAFTTVLYKGTAVLTFGSVDISQISLAGAISPIWEDSLEYYVTGDCTITIS